jgi:hypothetical protein
MTYELDGNPEDYPTTQLVKLRGGRYTTILKGPEGTDVGDLHCDLEPFEEAGMRGFVTHSGWMTSPEQDAMLAAGAHIRLAVYQHPIPPLAVSVEPPICGCHGEKMDFYYDPNEGGSFTCRHVAGGDHEQTSNGSSAETGSGFEQAKADFRPLSGDNGTVDGD